MEEVQLEGDSLETQETLLSVMVMVVAAMVMVATAMLRAVGCTSAGRYRRWGPRWGPAMAVGTAAVAVAPSR